MEIKNRLPVTSLRRSYLEAFKCHRQKLTYGNPKTRKHQALNLKFEFPKKQTWWMRHGRSWPCVPAEWTGLRRKTRQHESWEKYRVLSHYFSAKHTQLHMRSQWQIEVGFCLLSISNKLLHEGFNLVNRGSFIKPNTYNVLIYVKRCHPS